MSTPADIAERVDDVRIRSISPIPTPIAIRNELPITDRRAAKVATDRREIAAILAGDDSRLLVIVGPCSIHDPVAAVDYARQLAPMARRYADSLKVVMRTYFEKPRTTVGWKGLINDPGMDGSHDVERGLRTARSLVLDIIDVGLPVGCEFLEPVGPQYLADAVSWGAIGARTTESQVHRQLASGLSMPVGFKNGTDGHVGVAIDGVRAAASPHVFFGVDDLGGAAMMHTTGNVDAHVILRGGRTGTNFDAESIADAAQALDTAGVPPRVVVDCSHANSGKDHTRQPVVAQEIANQLAAGSSHISGVMLESFLIAGAQAPQRNILTYGQSVTDACIDIDTTEQVLNDLAAAMAR